MAKARKKTVKQYLPKTRKNQILFFVILFAIIGSIALFIVRAANSVSDELLASSNLAIGYTDAGSVSIERDTEGNITAFTRPRAIDVSKGGVLYCTPEDNGTITQRQLSVEEQEEADSRIILTRPSTTVTNEPERVHIGSEPSVYVDGFESYINGSSYVLSEDRAFVTGAIEYLEQLCMVPGTPIPSGDSPDIILVYGRESGLTVRETLSPTAHAGGAVAPGTGFFQVNVQHESVQNILMADNRQRNGLPPTQATSCLSEAAREWTRVMVSIGFIRHTDRLSTLPEKYCGKGGWSKLGENVGVSGLRTPNNDEASAAASRTVFNAFMASPGHRKNILDPQFTHHGVGSYTSPDGKKVYVTQIFWAGRSLPK